MGVTWSDQGGPVSRLNELEYVEGEILANVWLTSQIARIDPETGRVKGWIDLSPLVATEGMEDGDAVLNGIAYDAKNDRLFVTGKNWPHLYEIEIERLLAISAVIRDEYSVAIMMCMGELERKRT